MKVIATLILCLVSVVGFSQIPQTRITGQSTQLIIHPVWRCDTCMKKQTFKDTLNLPLSFLNTPGIFIFTTSDLTIWFRNNTSSKWIPVGIGDAGSIKPMNDPVTDSTGKIKLGGSTLTTYTPISIKPNGQ